jgi:hypothetical protein
MTMKAFLARFLEPASMWLMIIGVVSLCQPWVSGLHLYSTTMTLVGLVGFNIAVHLPAPAPTDDRAENAHHG